MELNFLFLQSFFANIVKDLTEISIANALGIIAVILKVVEYQLKKRSTRIVLALMGNFCWIVYFFLKGSYASTISGFVAVTSNVIFLLREKHSWAKGIWWLFLFLAMTAANCIFGFKSWFDIFAILAGLFGIIAYFVIDDKLYRYLSFFCMFSWLLNSIFNQFGIALVNDAFATVSVVVAILRLYVFKRGKKDKPNDKKKTEITQ
jgi:hypothetical protein